jgi:hypothetical protein
MAPYLGGLSLPESHEAVRDMVERSARRPLLVRAGSGPRGALPSGSACQPGRQPRFSCRPTTAGPPAVPASPAVPDEETASAAAVYGSRIARNRRRRARRRELAACEPVQVAADPARVWAGFSTGARPAAMASIDHGPGPITASSRNDQQNRAARSPPFCIGSSARSWCTVK